MKENRSTFRLFLAAALFAGFLALFFLDLTGVKLHQWLGIAGGFVAAYHLAEHWEWVKAVTGRFFGRTSWQARFYYLIDAGLVLGFGFLIFSGLLISTWFDLALTGPNWSELHSTIAIFTLGIEVVKIALHARWITTAIRRLAFQPVPRPAAARLQAAPARQNHHPMLANNSRGDFLRLMGLVGAAAGLAIVTTSIPRTSSTAAFQEPATEGEDLPAADTPANTHTSSSPAATSTEVPTSTAVPNNANTNSSTLVCSGSCRKGRHCAFPGECHDYRDTNGNGLCDRGEC